MVQIRMLNNFMRLLLALIASIAFFAIACGAKENPFAVGDRGTPTPTAIPGANVTPLPTSAEPWFDTKGKGIVRFAEWSDKPVRLANSMTGYIVVHGFDYNVELITVEQAAAQEALLKGQVDILTHFDRTAQKEWYDAQLAAGAIIDLGFLYQSKPEIRLIGNSSLTQRAPEIVKFMGLVKPGDDAFIAQAELISSGRVGINPIVAWFTFFKDYPTLLSGWVPPDVSARVQKAITDGKNSLRNRACPPHDPFGTSVDC